MEAGALAERNTFQGERCIYNALNDRIRNLLLQYDFSKSSDPNVYWSSHLSSLIDGKLSDISLSAGQHEFSLHKFVLASRTPYFSKKLRAQPETASWKLASGIPAEAFRVALRYVYLGDLPRDLAPAGSSLDEQEVLTGLDKISKQLEIEQLWEAILISNDRRMARQRYQDEVERAIAQFGSFFTENVLGKKMIVDIDRVNEVKWKHDNSTFSDILLRADEPIVEDEDDMEVDWEPEESGNIPVGPAGTAQPSSDGQHKPRKSVLYPTHRAMLLRSEYFSRMFSGDFVETQVSTHLRVVTLDCSPQVLEAILRFLYTENTDSITLDIALDLLYAADMLFLDSLKTKAAIAISTLGSAPPTMTEDGMQVEPINIYDVIHAAWDLRVQRLEEFAARYLANRLEYYIEDDDFADLIRESAGRLKKREETDTIELLDDIRYYLGERFRQRFEDTGLGDVLDETRAASYKDADKTSAEATPAVDVDMLDETEAQPKSNEEALREAQDEGDEFTSDQLNYEMLHSKIDLMLEKLKLGA